MLQIEHLSKGCKIMASQKAMIKMSIFAELYKFVKPYYTQTFLFLVALVITAGVTLAIGQGLKLVIDEGFLSLIHI